MPTSPRYQVVLVTHYFSTHGGGVESVAIQIAQRVAEKYAVGVRWFASDCDAVPSARRGVGFEPMRSWNGLERLGFPWPVWGLRSLLRLRKAIAAADVVHVHDYIYFGNLAAFFFARWFGKPVVVTQHVGDIPYDNRLLGVILKVINRSFGTFVLGRAEQVVFYSEVVRTQFLRSVSFKSEPCFWPNGVDTIEYSGTDDLTRSSIKSRLAANPQRTVFLFVGRFVEKKGMPLLRQLVKEFGEIEWWILGWGATNAAFDPATWQLPNMKIFFDRSGAILVELYRAADLLVLPSKGEGFPLVVQQAMACGTPAMVSNATADAVPDTRPFLITCDLDGSQDDFGKACGVLRYSLETGKLLTLRSLVGEHARREWSWTLNADRYGTLYERLGGMARMQAGCT
ncbi:MAG: glycosyltransferase family 4 protein [Betaproteobacteria bacterium]